MRRSVTLIVVAAFALVAFASEAQAANPGFIYWTNGATGGIGRAKLDGTDVNQSFIAGAREPSGVVVSDKYVYWGNAETGTIGRATLNGLMSTRSSSPESADRARWPCPAAISTGAPPPAPWDEPTSTAATRSRALSPAQ
jgi:Low-density lipoprotein receptor repeat class B